jgi:hypothetical protein
MPELRLSDRLRFGKYEGELLSTVIRKDPSYILWCMDSLDDFTLDWEAERELDWELDQ